MGEAHPWQAFLEARLAAIAWMMDDGKTEREILLAMNMDLTQITLLKMTIAERRERGGRHA